jgi:hypothetical protein
LPNDPRTINKARKLIDHKELWLQHDGATYFNSASILGTSFTKVKVTEERIAVKEAAVQDGYVTLPSSVEGEMDVDVSVRK